MKSKLFILLASVVAVSASSAATTVSYIASDSPAASPDANSNTIDAWSTSTVGGNAGFFNGDSAGNGDGNGAGAGSSAWAIYANSNDQGFASHTFAGGALVAGQTVGLDFDNGYIDNSKSAGIQIRSGATILFAFYFKGGSSFYQYLDAGGADIDTSQGFTDDGGNFTFTLNSATGYSASFAGAAWTGTISNSAVDNIQVYNDSAGPGSAANVYFNNLTVVPEPTSAALALLSAALILRRRRI